VSSTSTSSGAGTITPKAPQVGHVSATAATPALLQTPPNLAAGDVLVMILNVQPDPGPNSVSPPSGWTSLGDSTFPTCNNFRDFFAWHTAGSAEPSMYSITLPTDGTIDYAIVDYAGVNPTSPFGTPGAPGPLNGTAASQQLEWDAGSIQTYSANNMLLLMLSDIYMVNWTAPTGMTQRVPSPLLGIFDELYPQVGSSGDKVVGVDSVGGCGAYLFAALQPK
jgi:hypothetical protein